MHINHADILDVAGIGLGPFNLSLAALLSPLVKQGELKAAFFERKSCFDWHPGLLLPGTTLQVPFLADLVSMADPTSPFTYLNYLHEKGRLYQFYFRENFLVPRREYNLYCRWVSEQLAYCHFDASVTQLQWLEETQCFALSWLKGAEQTTVYARHLVLGIGTEAHIPEALKTAAEQWPDKVFHTAALKQRLPEMQALGADKKVTVLGSGQSAAEAFQHLLGQQADQGFALDWMTRSAGFFPMEYSKLGLQHFTPDYIHYMRTLSQQTRDQLIPTQGLLYKGISATTIAEIYDLLYERTIDNEVIPVTLLAHAELAQVNTDAQGRFVLRYFHREQQRHFEVVSDYVVAGTGYQTVRPGFIDGIESLIERDQKGRYQIDDEYRLQTAIASDNRIFIQNGELHTHGIAAPDLGLGAYRSSVIINTLMQRAVYKTRPVNSCMQFGVNPDQALSESDFSEAV